MLAWMQTSINANYYKGIRTGRSFERGFPQGLKGPDETARNVAAKAKAGTSIELRHNQRMRRLLELAKRALIEHPSTALGDAEPATDLAERHRLAPSR